MHQQHERTVGRARLEAEQPDPVRHHVPAAHEPDANGNRRALPVDRYDGSADRRDTMSAITDRVDRRASRRARGTGAAGCQTAGAPRPRSRARPNAAPRRVTPGPTINVAGHGEVDGTPDVIDGARWVYRRTGSGPAWTIDRNNLQRRHGLIAALKATGRARPRTSRRRPERLADLDKYGRTSPP